MAFKIDETLCIACGACADECPMAAISQKEEFYWIDPQICNNSGNCADICPVGAPKPDVA